METKLKIDMPIITAPLLSNLSRYGLVQICKADYVFTLLITGENLSRGSVYSEITTAVLNFVGDRYPIVETVRNDENFFCLVLKPRS